MKKVLKSPTLLTLLFSIFLIGISTSQNTKKNDLEKMNLYGNVKTFTETRYDAIMKFGEAIKEAQTYRFYYSFNNKGNKIELNTFNSDGSLDTKVIYKYDDKDNLIELNRYNPDGSLETKY